jgi:hypothetical protein
VKAFHVSEEDAIAMTPRLAGRYRSLNILVSADDRLGVPKSAG